MVAGAADLEEIYIYIYIERDDEVMGPDKVIVGSGSG